MKVLTVLGTRPEIVRLSRVMARLDTYCDHVLVHTGQNYDHELNGIFFDDLGLRLPDRYLDVNVRSLGTVVGGILTEIEKVLFEERPDAVLILGDTNSSIAAYMARRMKIPVYHMEAGNRCFDRNVPEETNRMLIDHLADFNLVYTEHARRNLLAEGISARRIYLTGSPMREVLDYYGAGIEQSTALETLGVQPGRYILASLHREENVDSQDNLRSLVSGLSRLAREYDCPVVISTHPRTHNRLESLPNAEQNNRLRWLKPFGFLDYNKLQKNALCVLSDSGTIAEESSILGFPAVTPRFSIERPEAIDTGAIIACGYASDDVLRCVNAVIQQASVSAYLHSRARLPKDYQVTNTSQRVVNLILGTAPLSNAWDGIRENCDVS